MLEWLFDRISHWLVKEGPVSQFPLSNYQKLSAEIEVGDVILVEGRSRVAYVIRSITNSPWTHAALYLGRYEQLPESQLKEAIKAKFDEKPDAQYIIESMLGEGTYISPLYIYRLDHLRICRPMKISPEDIQRVVDYAFRSLGKEYDVRQIMDLARFLFPWSILPRRWRSSLFEHNIGEPTKTVCSSMIARAFQSVRFPILPLIALDDAQGLKLYVRNPRLFTPKDFDYSPYFQIIKYPFIDMDAVVEYKDLPWVDEDIHHNDNVENILSAEQILKFTQDEDRFNGLSQSQTSSQTPTSQNDPNDLKSPPDDSV